MQIRIERVRVWLLASAGLLVVVIAGFIGTARYLRRHWLQTLPARLGANVKIDTSGITWSHTYQGRTDYVIHAARDVEHDDGKVALHDVWIKLCGRAQRRADMVRGDDWEWDKKAHVIRALGEVHIELRDNGDRAGCTSADDSGAPDARNGRTIHATTSNLIYMQELGVAATSAPIEFATGTIDGHAVGADYASDSGTLMLHSAVNMQGTSAGQPVRMEAASAELDGQQRLARFTGAKYMTGTGAAARAVAADRAVLHLRADQTLERIEAEGAVNMLANGAALSAAKADVTMNAVGHPVSALLTGNVRYTERNEQAEREGSADRAVIQLDGKTSPQVQHAVFLGAAHLAERTRADVSSGGNTRELTAAKLDLALVAGAQAKNEVRDAEASGGARFTEENTQVTQAQSGKQSRAPRRETTEIAADDLKAHFGAMGSSYKNSRLQIETIAGLGHTLVRRVSADGAEQTSAGDTLDARFHQEGVSGKKDRAVQAHLGDTDGLASAVQTGHIVVTRRDPGKKDSLRATAQQASFDGNSNRITLSGDAQLTETGGHLWAREVEIDRISGDAHAVGGVKGDYAQSVETRPAPADAAPMHVLADRADLDHTTDTTIFHGAPVRMWQEAARIEAPVIEVARTAKRLYAHGQDVGAAGTQVHTVLASEGGAHTGTGQSAQQSCIVSSSSGTPHLSVQDPTQPQVIRIASGALVYTDTAREADFVGGFRAEIADATVHANMGTVYLKARSGAVASGADEKMPSLNGSIDRLSAKGQIAITQPGMRASGQQLIYTAAEESFLLTGNAADPPRALDGHGNVTTGAALEFHRACNGTGGDTVQVLNKLPGGAGGPSGGVHTEVEVDTTRGQSKR